MASTPASPDKPPVSDAQRLRSLDTYRGIIMTVLAFEGFHLAWTAQNFPDSKLWQSLGSQFQVHTQWVGCNFWDLILPSFMFMVGVSMPYSYAKREKLGHSFARQAAHAAVRSVVLVLLGVFLFRMSGAWPSVSGLMNVLAQIGLGYFFVFFLWKMPEIVKLLAVAAVLGGTWAMYSYYPTEGVNLETGSPELLWWTGQPAQWAQTYLAGIDPIWHANANAAAAFDVWLFDNILGHRGGFQPGAAGYQILGFIPEMAMMLFGMMAGGLLRSRCRTATKTLALFAFAVWLLAAGLWLNNQNIIPMIKKIYTPSFALFSAGWCFMFLGVLYLVVDVIGLRRWAWPFIVVGMNSIVMYVIYMLMRPFTAEMYRKFLGEDIFALYGRVDAYAPTIEAVFVGLFLWVICYYLYRQKIFIRI